MPTGHDSNHTLANLFLSMAELLKKHGENPYRIRAYQRAADTIANLESPVAKNLFGPGDLRTLARHRERSCGQDSGIRGNRRDSGL